MQSIDALSHLQAVRLRTERATRRATLLASLGPLPKPERLRPFARRTTPLQTPVDITHAAARRTANVPPQAA